MKRLLLLIGVLFFFSSPLFAGLGNVGTDLTNAVSASIGAWTNAFSSAGAFIFYALATIELVIVFGMLAIRGELDFGAIMANLIRLTLIFGFWMMLLGTFGIDWMKTIPKSFEQLASSASGTGISTDNMFSLVGDVYNNLWSALSFWDNPAESFMLVLVGFIAIIALILLGVKILTNLVMATLAVYMSSLFFAFGVFSLTRQWAINSIVNVLRYGAKYMAVLIMAGLGITLLNGAIAAAKTDMSTGNIFVVLIFSFILLSLAHGIESFIDGYFTGMGGGENTLGGALAKSMALGAGIGAVGAGANSLSQIQAAAAATETPGSPSSPGGGGSPGGGSTENTAKSGNFINTAKAAAKNVSAVGLGAIGGATTGILKGAMGISTHGAGTKTGNSVGKSINATSSAVKKVTGGNKAKEKTLSLGESGSKLAEGTISKGSGSNNPSSYVSAVPGANSVSSESDNTNQSTITPNIKKPKQ